VQSAFIRGPPVRMLNVIAYMLWESYKWDTADIKSG